MIPAQAALLRETASMAPGRRIEPSHFAQPPPQPSHVPPAQHSASVTVHRGHAVRRMSSASDGPIAVVIPDSSHVSVFRWSRAAMNCSP